MESAALGSRGRREECSAEKAVRSVQIWLRTAPACRFPEMWIRRAQLASGAPGAGEESGAAAGERKKASQGSAVVESGSVHRKSRTRPGDPEGGSSRRRRVVNKAQSCRKLGQMRKEGAHRTCRKSPDFMRLAALPDAVFAPLPRDRIRTGCRVEIPRFFNRLLYEIGPRI